MDLLGLLLRVGLSLAVVIGLMWLAARALRSAGGGRGAGVVEVVARQALGRGSAVAVVRIADKALVLGVTDGQVTLLGETDLAAVEASRAPERRSPAPVAIGTDAPALVTAARGRLDGSILSPRTWRRTVEAVRDRTVRK